MRALRLVTVAALAAGVVAPLGGAQAAPPVPPVYVLCKPVLYPWDVLYPVAHVTLVRPGLVC